MKWLLIAIATLFAGFLLAEFGDRGYVMMRVAGWTLETSFVIFAALAIFGAWATSLFWHNLIHVLRMPRRLRHWLGHRWSMRRRGSLNKGLSRLTEGYWSEAERYLSHVPAHDEHAQLAYLGAAWAAHYQGKVELRDTYLDRARDTTGDSPLAVALTDAQIKLSEQRGDSALTENLRLLRKQHQKHPHVIKLLAESAVQSKDWSTLADLLPQLRKQKSIHSNQIANWEQALNLGLLDQAASHGDVSALKHQWRKLSSAAHKDTTTVLYYAQLLARHDAVDDAAQLLNDALNQHWDDSFAAMLGELNVSKPGHQLSIIERWLTSRPDNAILLLTASKIAFKHELWGKARSYAEASLAINPSAAAYRELAQIQEFLGDNNAALNSYRIAADWPYQTVKS